MSSTVLHIDPELHEAFKRHCQANERPMKERLEELIRQELADREVQASLKAQAAAEERRLEVMRQRRLRLVRPLAPLPTDSRDPWTRPAFWTQPGYQPPAPATVKPKVEPPDEHTFTLN